MLHIVTNYPYKAQQVGVSIIILSKCHKMFLKLHYCTFSNVTIGLSAEGGQCVHYAHIEKVGGSYLAC